ncbi:MAG: glutathione synthase [Candidatus Omnitrophota bacterium]|jgi:glutathione synthase
MSPNKKILFIMDPLKALNQPVDTSLLTARILAQKGWSVYGCEMSSIYGLTNGVCFDVYELIFAENFLVKRGIERRINARELAGILIRKEPPFDQAYYQMTCLLDLVNPRVWVSNDPTGIRSVNEKLSALNFADLVPKTLVSASAQEINLFFKQLKGPGVLKPIDQKWGLDVLKCRYGQDDIVNLAKKQTQSGKRYCIAQAFVVKKKHEVEKRLTLLNGKILFAYEKRPAKGDFRGNLHMGGSWHACRYGKAEEAINLRLKPYLKQHGIHLAGVDIIGSKLIEINVTCPGALWEADQLYPEVNALQTYARFIQTQINRSQKS